MFLVGICFSFNVKLVLRALNTGRVGATVYHNPGVDSEHVRFIQSFGGGQGHLCFKNNHETDFSL